MKISELKVLLNKFDNNILYNLDLKNKSWFNIGGKTKVFFKADELNHLVEVLKILNNREKYMLLELDLTHLFQMKLTME